MRRRASLAAVLALVAGALAAPVCASGTVSGEFVTPLSAALSWATGGTYAVGPTAELVGPTDTGMFLSAGAPTSNVTGNGLTISASSGGGTSGPGGLLTMQGGASIGIDSPAGGSVWSTGANTGAGGQGNLVLATAGAGSGGSTTPNAVVNRWGVIGVGNWQGTSALLMGWVNSTTDPTGTVDTCVSRQGAGIVQVGTTAANDAGTLYATTITRAAATTGTAISVAGGAATAGGSDKSAGTITVAAGRPTGTGIAHVDLQAYYQQGTGTTAQTVGDRFFICGKQTAMSTTTATATDFCDMLVPNSNTSGGCTVAYMIEASDGTDWATANGSFAVSAVNKAGTVTGAAAAIVGESSLSSKGATTLTAGTTSTGISGTHVQIKCAPVWTTIVPTSVKIHYTITAFGKGVTLSPQ